MSDKCYPLERGQMAPTSSASSPNTTTQNQQQVPNSQDGGRDAQEEQLSKIASSSLAAHFAKQVQNPILYQQQVPDSQDGRRDAPEEQLRTITSPSLAAHFADQMQVPIPYQQQRHLAVGNPQTPGSKPYPKVILAQSFRDRASSNMMVWSFVQAMDNMAEGRV